MALLNEKKFSFISLSGQIPDNCFAVVSFTGYEAISKPYEIELTLVSDNQEIDPLLILQNPAKFTIHRDEGRDVDFNGILMQFEESQEFNGYLFFKAVLAPKLWWLSLTHHNQVFLDLTIPEIMEQALKDGGLAPGIDFEFRLQTKYEKLEYICQYDESHLNFVSRWAEREGIYYFFEQTVNGEKVVFTDTKISHADLVYNKKLFYQPQSGLDSLHTKEVIKKFICKHNMLPMRVYLKDYNYLKPSLAIEGIADVDEEGRGENYIYGEHFDTPEQGNRLAEIRAEELKCRKSLFFGESSVPFMVPGFTFDLKDYYKDIYNRKYLITEVNHEGHQTGYLISGLTEAMVGREEAMQYKNSFTAIYSDAQFRPVQEAVKPKISGTLNAKIDAAASGEYAELDELGRYKVILPFDRSGRFNGKASAWFRMMQPYAGQNKGMHFPLHKGTEVLLTFIDGDPDRPVIAGAVPNSETSSPVTSEQQTMSIIKSNRDRSLGNESEISEIKDNFIELQDSSGHERIKIHSDGNLWFEAQNRYAEYTIGGPTAKADVPEGLKYLWDKFYKTADPDFAPTGMEAYSYGDSATGPTPDVDTSSLKKLAKTGKVKLAKGDTFNTQEGNIYDFGGYWNYNLGNCYVEEHLNQSAELNKTQNFDLMDKGGPGWTKVDWSKAQDNEASEAPSEDDIKIEDTIDWTNSGNGVWVEKKFGHSYNYTQGDSIEVTKGSSLGIQHGGEHVKLSFMDNKDNPDELGSIASWSRTKGAKSEEKRWLTTGIKWHESWKDGLDSSERQYDSTTGDLVTYSTKSNHGGSIASFNCGFCAKTSADFNFGAAASFSFSSSLSTGISISAAASAKMNINFAADFELKTGLGIGLELDLRAGGTFKLAPSGGLKYDGIGFTARKKALVEAKKSTIEAEARKLRLQKIELNLKNPRIVINNTSTIIQKKTIHIENTFNIRV